MAIAKHHAGIKLKAILDERSTRMKSKEDIIKETIKYSKRQKTFFNNQFNNVNKIEYLDINEAILDIETILKKI